MASQLALDILPGSVRFVEIDGSLKKPLIKRFGAAALPPIPEGEDPIRSHGKALNAALKAAGVAREPSGAAFEAGGCTFREIDLPYTSDAEISRVVKFEAESHLHLLDIDEVVVSYQRLRTTVSGAHLLIMAYEKGAILEKLSVLQGGGVDPQFADLHLAALYAALRESGYVGAAVADPDAEPGTPPPPDEPLLVLECDPQVTNILVVLGEQLLAARAVRIGQVPSTVPADGEDGEDSEGESLIVIDDLPEGEGLPPGPPNADYYHRLTREVQRTLLPLGFAESAREALLLGSYAHDPEFQQTLANAIGLEVSVARPFDEFAHKLDEESLELANAHGVAALGVGLRLLGANHSRVDFRQEECAYAKRFDQVKVALACFAIMLFIAVGLPTIEKLKQLQISRANLREAAYAALQEYQFLAEDTSLKDQLQRGEVAPQAVALKVRDRFRQECNDLASQLGREGELPRVDSGLNYMNDLMTAIDRHMNVIQRLELNQIELDLNKESPKLTLQGKVLSPAASDALVKALRSAEVTESLTLPRTEPTTDGRVKFTNLEVTLKKGLDVIPGGGQ